MFACSGTSSPATGLVLGLQLELAVPSDTDHVAVLVTLIQGERRTTQAPASLSPIESSGVNFVATLVLESHDPSDRVQVRFIAFDADGKVRAMREALTRVPQQGTALLRMPLLWINDGLVQDSGAGPLASQNGELALASVATQSLTDDGFARLSMIGCAAEETRGNDGACRPIAADDELEPLPNSSVTVKLAPCFEVNQCFSGPEVRRVDLAAMDNCEIHIEATAGTPKPALGFTGPSTGGFPVNDADVPELVRPADDALYTYLPERHVLRLNEALCAKVLRDRIPTAIVSAKCAPKQTNTLVCASYNKSDEAPPFTDGVFVGSPDGGPGLTDADADADADAPPAVIEQTLDLPAPNVRSFAARNSERGAQGTLWVMAAQLSGASAIRTQTWPSPSTSGSDVLAPSLSYPTQAQLVIGAGKRAYLLAEFPSPYPTGGDQHVALGDGTPALPPTLISICGPDACGASGGCADAIRPQYFSAGEQGNATVGTFAQSAYAASPILRVGGLVARGGTAGCFERRPADVDASSFVVQGSGYNLTPGIVYGDAYLTMLNTSVGVDRIAQIVRSTDTQTSHTAHGEWKRVAAFGANRALTATFDNSGSTFASTLGVVEPNLVDGATLPVAFGNVHELFGGPNVACMRATKDYYSAPFVVCVREQAGVLETVQPVLDGTTYPDGAGSRLEPFDAHVYADPDFLYVAQVCGSSQLKVRGVRWSLLQTAAQIEGAFTNLCGGNIGADGGAP